MKGYYFVNTELYNKRAHSIQILNTVAAINKAGGDLSIIVPNFSGSNLSEKDIFAHYAITPIFPVTSLFIFFLKRASRLSFFLFAISSFFYLLSLLFRGKVDYIYFRSEFFYPLTILTALFKVPYFYEIHREGRTEKTQKLKEKIARNAKGIIVLTEVLKKRFSKANKNVLVAHDGVNPDRFKDVYTTVEARKKLGIGERGIVALYIGTLSETKGTELIFENASKLPEITFFLIGQNRLSSSHSKPQNVVIRDAILQKDVSLYQQMADVLLLTNPKNIFSQSPIKLFEYMTSGRVIISSNLPNIREVIQEDTSLFYDPDDPEDFVRICKKYALNKPLFDDKAKKNKELVKEYTWEKRGKAIQTFIETA